MGLLTWVSLLGWKARVAPAVPAETAAGTLSEAIISNALAGAAIMSNALVGEAVLTNARVTTGTLANRVVTVE